MNTSHRIIELQPKIDFVEVLRYLGGAPPAPPLTQQLMTEMLPLAQSLLHSRGIWTVVDSHKAFDDHLFPEIDTVGVALVTIGQNLEKRVEDMTNSGDLKRAVILDALGSVAAESAADQLHIAIRRTLQDQGLCARQRVSPGYGSFSIQSQRTIFEILPAQKLGVQLLPSLFMLPKKSVSFAVPFIANLSIQQKESTEKNGKNCAHCSFIECAFRRPDS